MRIGIDAMGSDHAPAEEAKGALAAREFLTGDDHIVLFGDEKAIRPHLDGTTGWQDRITIHHTDQAIGMNEKPVEALRAKPNSSIAMLAQAHAESKVDACISAGNTGAFVAAASMRLKRIPGLHRPGIAVVTPTYYGPVILCDVGANVSCRPQHLHQYGIMSSIFSRVICGIANPRVGLLSVGEEEAKGNDLVKKTYDLLKNDSSVNFTGNAEGRDIFRGTFDVVVCEGFVGNVVLKLMEGMAEAVVRAIVGEAAAVAPQHVDGVKLAAKSLLHKWDFNEYGGAPLLGVDGICIICHGASDFRGIKNAVRVAKDFSARQVNPQIAQQLKSHLGAAS